MTESRKARLSHVAFLVPSVETSAEGLGSRGFPVGPSEIWEGEGTREIYVGDPKRRTGTLLLMEPVSEGAYSRAMKKRGPGLHHVAIDVLDLEGYLTGIASSGWLLHPKSLETIPSGRTAWLARPGMPALIEVHGREVLPVGEAFVTGMGIPRTGEYGRFFGALGLDGFFFPTADAFSIRAEGAEIHFSDIIAVGANAGPT